MPFDSYTRDYSTRIQQSKIKPVTFSKDFWQKLRNLQDSPDEDIKQAAEHVLSTPGHRVRKSRYRGLESEIKEKILEAMVVTAPGLSIPSFRPPSSFEVSGSGVDSINTENTDNPLTTDPLVDSMENGANLYAILEHIRNSKQNT